MKKGWARIKKAQVISMFIFSLNGLFIIFISRNVFQGAFTHYINYKWLLLLLYLDIHFFQKINCAHFNFIHYFSSVDCCHFVNKRWYVWKCTFSLHTFYSYNLCTCCCYFFFALFPHNVIIVTNIMCAKHDYAADQLTFSKLNRVCVLFGCHYRCTAPNKYIYTNKINQWKIIKLRFL